MYTWTITDETDNMYEITTSTGAKLMIYKHMLDYFADTFNAKIIEIMQLNASVYGGD